MRPAPATRQPIQQDSVVLRYMGSDSDLIGAVATVHDPTRLTVCLGKMPMSYLTDRESTSEPLYGIPHIYPMRNCNEIWGK